MRHTLQGDSRARRFGRGIKTAAIAGVLVLGVAGAATAVDGSAPTSEAAASARTIAAPAVPAARNGVVVPSVVGKSKTSAIKRLRARGYVVKTRTKSVSHGSSGIVLSQKPKAHAVRAPGSKITLTISKVSKPAASSHNCTPGYSPCLSPASDYDCAGGSGNGPKYVNSTVKVTGSDPYGLDNDGDGYGCD